MPPEALSAVVQASEGAMEWHWFPGGVWIPSSPRSQPSHCTDPFIFNFIFLAWIPCERFCPATI